jgi:hypothetical protein
LRRRRSDERCGGLAICSPGGNRVVAEIYVKFGASPAVADEHATVLLAALEGALVLARAHRSTDPFDTVERYFAAAAPGLELADLD